MSGDYFVILYTQSGGFTHMTDSDGEGLATFETEEEARKCARDNILGENFGYEIFEYGCGVN